MDKVNNLDTKPGNSNKKRYKGAVQNKFNKKAAAITPQFTDDLSTNMFDTNINVLGSLTDIVIDDPPSKFKGASLSQSGRFNRPKEDNMVDQTESLIFQIKTLEAQLVKRTSEVLKNTEMLKEYKNY